MYESLIDIRTRPKADFRDTYFPRLKFDCHLFWVCTLVKDRDRDLFVGLVEFISVYRCRVKLRSLCCGSIYLGVVMVVKNDLKGAPLTKDRIGTKEGFAETSRNKAEMGDHVPSMSCMIVRTETVIESRLY